MKFPTSAIITFLFAFFLVTLLAVVAEEDTLCPCQFDGNDNSDDCRVYGQLGDDVLIPWHLASQECLDAHNSKSSAIPPFVLESICGDPPSANAFVNYLKQESSAASTSIKQSYGQFWNGDATPVTLVSTINGVDCDTDATGCWTEIRTYFEDNPEEIEDNCQTFYNAAAKDLETEQVTVRISICNAEIMAPDECGDLQTQVEQVQADNPNKACSAFGLGPVSGGPDQPPVCGDNGDGNVDDGDEGNTDTSTADRESTTGSSGSQNTCIWWTAGMVMMATVLLLANM